MSSELYVVVCGTQRSGTRQFCDYLNRHPEICMQGEISPPLIKDVHALVNAADDIYLNSKNDKYYRRKRGENVRLLFGMYSKAKHLVKDSATIHGFKTPHAEFHFDSLGKIVLPSYDRLEYFYCIRNIKNVYLSLTAMPWFGLAADAYFNKYIKSLYAAIKIKNSETANLNISALNLDDYIASADKAAWLNKKLFAKLDLEVSQAQLLDYVTSTKNINSTKHRFNVDRPSEITNADYKSYKMKKEDILEATRKFNKVFGETLNNTI